MTTADASQVSGGEYDYIIAGGGTAGCVLASRLSEDPSKRVLLIEAGGSGKGVGPAKMPMGYGGMLKGEHVWQLDSEPNAGALDRKIFYPRGKLLGGCSQINALVAMYGAPGDFDQYADIIGDDAWKWSNFQQYFKKFEKYTPNPEYPHVETSWKGTDGPVEIGYNTWVDGIHKRFVETCQTLGIPFNPDFNASGSALGTNRVMTFVDAKGARSSSESAYLTDEVLKRPNLKVLTFATCTKVITSGEGESLRAVGVEFKSQDGADHKVFAKKEVILSAGAIHSPHILLLSGIGSAADLNSHNVRVVTDLPGVGQNLIDHPLVPLGFKRSTNDSIRWISPKGILDAFSLVVALLTYLVFGRGPFSSNFVEAACMVRSDDPKLFPKDKYPEEFKDTTSAKDSPDIEIFTTVLGTEHGEKALLPVHSFGLRVALLRPNSKGYVKLASSNPSEAPVFNLGFLSDPEDRKKLARGLRLGVRIALSEPLNSVIDSTDPNPHLDHVLLNQSDEELEKFVQQWVVTVYHPVGSCSMKPLKSGGVVDSKLRVYGVKGLRVGDVSVLPNAISGHTAGAAFAVGEYLADIIKKEQD